VKAREDVKRMGKTVNNLNVVKLSKIRKTIKKFSKTYSFMAHKKSLKFKQHIANQFYTSIARA